jgi:dihydrodipicolinate synthase/N-acetylneuraminate lyase
MSANTPARSVRQKWLGLLFPGGPPRLWCPPLTHYDRDGAIDRRRIGAHLEFIAPHAKGLLVPGSTGDGWELTPAESREVLEIALDEAARLGLTVLAGALRPDTGDARRSMESDLAFLAERAGPGPVEELLPRSRVCGFAVCPPRGADLAQAEIEAGLAEILSSELPAALYQLPQITRNEISPDSTDRLASRFGNFILFKDTSGFDRVAKSGADLEGVFLVRGAEGGYAEALKPGGGSYDGLLLSTANSFAAPLHRIITLQESGQVGEAARLSARLAALVAELFQLVETVPAGNAFANAGKAADHFMAFGPNAAQAPPPRLHEGIPLPVEVIRAAGDALARAGFMPDKGYLE